MTLTILSPEEYQAHLKEVEQVSFLQTKEMAELLEKRGMKTQFVGLKKAGQLRVSALLYSLPMTGGLHMEINSGPVTNQPSDLPEFYRALQEYAKNNGALRLLVKPYQTYQTFDSDGKPISDQASQLIRDLTDVGYVFDGLQTGYPGGEPDWHYVKDLSQLTQETLFSSFSKKGKVLAKKANSFGIKVRALTRDELPLFKSITEATSDRREYQDKSLEYYQDFYDAFHTKADFLFASINFQDYLQHLEKQKASLENHLQAIEQDLEVNPRSKKKQNEHREISSQIQSFQIREAEARDLLTQYGQEDVPLAASLFVYTDHELVYLFSGSLTEFNKFYAPVVLQEYAMRKAIELKIPFYTLLGITGLFDGSDGVLRFKQNFNGFIVRKMGTFRYYPRPLKFKVLQSIKRIIGRN
ncbi:aminoacyltransferase [Streptococcus sp. X16XC17]|uniref:aminoacyltransferase n=1 Tax=unclassified Streptococcus TaxID=2608887 RepID=UPI00066FB44C|nr:MULTISPECIES: aminoacyltransferase [unclassified Streptococcus]TCD46702.1 aminoacyltransferase [Streptococcus sp. X16XC17]